MFSSITDKEFNLNRNSVQTESYCTIVLNSRYRGAPKRTSSHYLHQEKVLIV